EIRVRVFADAVVKVHKDFQSFALPSELQHHFAFGIAKIDKNAEVTKIFSSFFLILQNKANMIIIAFGK
ncbi:MAG: hypothetical protein II047_00015, partial [Bacteroidales bacterium]|nr:hypothetical protein [Bacteroidales bacterium]